MVSCDAEFLELKMVVGLGNPGETYEHTRHNVGFEVLDQLAGEEGVRWKRHWRAGARVGQSRLGREPVLLVKPQRYMNRSGRAVALLMRLHRLSATDLIVVVDDADLEPGHLRIRKKGSAGNHNGLKSVVAEVGTEEFVRLRVGVGGKPEGADMVDHVLSPFEPREREVIQEAVRRAAEAVRHMVEAGVESAMNRFN